MVHPCRVQVNHRLYTSNTLKRFTELIEPSGNLI